MTANSYKPEPGQLCQVYKDFDNVFPTVDSIDALITDPLTIGEFIIIMKATYQEEFSSFYVEYLREGRVFYSYFYEQVLCFEFNDFGVNKTEQLISTFDFPWVICE